ncbi:MAG: lamin tail domain-containing protein [Kiritimatiellae bacterium]|nr:lamin tail domain-containing protein [Kiritimatiellia bacterium]MDW8458478.1 Calx-beta domain-containing protein [Verrucomicrobiota bacterium]
MVSSSQANLIINEVFYNISPQGGNQFIELYNSGTNVQYLDGKILTDEAGDGSEGVFKFPGAPGGTSLPVSPGQYVVVAVDATNATATAGWECFAGLTDSDNPAVPNLTLVAGYADLGLFSGGDNIILADGTDTVPPIDPATVIDGLNFAGGGGELAPLGPLLPDPNPNASSPYGYSLGRCPDGTDNNISSLADLYPMNPTPGTPNTCTVASLSIQSISLPEGNSGVTTAQVPVLLSLPQPSTVTVQFFTSNDTALAGSDYFATNGTLAFAPGVQTQAIQVLIVADTVNEPDESFTVRLQNPTNASLAVAIGTVMILNDDTPLTIVTSAFVSIFASATSVSTRWESVSGGVYRLQASPSLTAPAWVDVGPPVTATASFASMLDTNTTATSRVYRVIQILP